MIAPTRTIAVLGTGTMGAPMARNLLRAGFGVRVWNRTVAKAAALAADGAQPARTAAAAAANADVLITMLAMARRSSRSPRGRRARRRSCALARSGYR